MDQLLLRLLTPRNSTLLLVLATSLLSMQSNCRSSSQTANLPSAANANNLAKVEKSESQMLELKLTSEKSRINVGECSDLTLTVHNSNTGTVAWKKDWIFEQQGPSPPLPESFPRSDIELRAGADTPVVTIRICAESLKPGIYQYRISTSATGSARAQSNQVSIEVVP